MIGVLGLVLLNLDSLATKGVAFDLGTLAVAGSGLAYAGGTIVSKACIARCSPASLRATKQSALDALHLPLSEAATYVSDAEAAWRTSPDRIEGPRAFAEKRDPDWA